MKSSEKTAYYGIFAGLAIIMGWVEMMIPVPIPVPGVKLGLANVIVVMAMYYFGNKTALGISIIRIIISGLLFSGFSGFLYSMAGAILSFTVMVIAKNILKFNIYSVSILGGICHNIGQIVVASLVVKTNLSIYMPILIISGIITGALIGIIAKNCLNHIKR